MNLINELSESVGQERVKAASTPRITSDDKITPTSLIMKNIIEKAKKAQIRERIRTTVKKVKASTKKQQRKWMFLWNNIRKRIPKMKEHKLGMSL